MIGEAKDFDSVVDEFLNKEENETSTETSTETKPEGEETKTPEAATAEVDKTEQLKEVDADESLSIEDKLNKVKDIIGDDEKAIDAYIKQKGYHNDPAWIKQREIIDRLKTEGEQKALMSDEDRAALDNFKKFSSSAEYIKMSMKEDGFTQEAIEKKLKEQGFDIATKSADDVQLVLNKLDIKTEGMEPAEAKRIKAYIEDVSKVADVIIQDRLAKVLPKELGPIQDHIGNMKQSSNATKMINTIKDTVKTEGILDYDQDIEPELDKFINDNPDALQPDIYEHFRQINHSLTIERLKTGKRKEERDDKKTKIRQNVTVAGSPRGLPKKSGNFESDADAFLDTVNII